jgi:hypothetical protein
LGLQKYEEPEEDDDENDNVVDWHVIAAEIHDEDSVSEEFPKTSGETMLYLKNTHAYTKENDFPTRATFACSN